MTGPEANSEIYFPRISMFQNKTKANFEKRAEIRPPLITCNSGQHFARNRELFPV